MSQDTKTTVGRESDKFMLRFPDGMRERIAEQAKLNNRSMNAEIVSRLEESFSTVDRESAAPALARMSVALSLTDAEKLIEQLRTTLLATQVRRLSQLLLPLIDPCDEGIRAEIKKAVDQANEFIHSTKQLRDQAQQRALGMREELAHMERLAGIIESDDLVAAALADIADTGGRIADSRLDTPVEIPLEHSNGTSSTSGSLPHAADAHPNLAVGDNASLPAKRMPRRKKAAD